MRVVCPHVGEPQSATRAALDRYAPSVSYHDVGGSDTAYAELVCELWASGEGFAIVEHDIVVRPDVIREFWTSPYSYVAYPYRWGQAVGVALGCTRFSSLFLRALPHAAEIARRIPTVYGVPGHWRQFDVWLQAAVLRDLYGWQPHGLLPPVEHLNWQDTPADAPLRLRVEGRMYLEPGLVERIAVEVAAERKRASALTG